MWVYRKNIKNKILLEMISTLKGHYEKWRFALNKIKSTVIFDSKWQILKNVIKSELLMIVTSKLRSIPPF